MQGGKRKRKSINVTGTKLKIYGYIAMVLYSLGMSVFSIGLLKLDLYSDSELATLLSGDGGIMAVASLTVALQLVGGLAVPVFAYLLVEGFVHTSDYKRYILGMLAVAIISEIPYDMAYSLAVFDTSSQNPMFSMVICLIMLYGLHIFEGERDIFPEYSIWSIKEGERTLYKGIFSVLCRILVIFAALFWCGWLNLNMGICLVLLTAVYYLFYKKDGTRIILGCIISLMYITGPVSGYALWAYGGDRGKKHNKKLFYAVYPLHLILMAAVTWALRFG